MDFCIAFQRICKASEAYGTTNSCMCICACAFVAKRVKAYALAIKADEIIFLSKEVVHTSRFESSQTQRSSAKFNGEKIFVRITEISRCLSCRACLDFLK